MFHPISHIDDIRPAVEHKREIRFHRQPNGLTVGCYQFMDSSTFDSPQALECRGIAFNEDGSVASRPLHKFFNLGEKEHLSPDRLAQRKDLVAVFEKLDGSMLATAWVNGEVHWRSKKSFTSDVVRLTLGLLKQPQFSHINTFAHEVASQGMTAIFEMMHPEARIVVEAPQPSLRLLHVRDNHSGAYVMLQKDHPIHDLVARHGIEKAPRFEGLALEDVLRKLETMQNQEGYVLQFADGDMVKLKCPWYLRLHRSVTFLRERDIALSALNEELDDLKAVLAETGIDLGPVNEVEARVKARMLELMDHIDKRVQEGAGLERKDFALKFRSDPLFGLMMAQYLGKEVDLRDWFIKNRLKDEFSLRVLADGALADALEG